MKREYEIKGIVLDELDMRSIKEYYEVSYTAEYLMENYELTEEEAMRLGAEVRRYMDKNNVTEDIAIDEIMSTR